MKAKITSTVLASLACALSGLSVPMAASADDPGWRDWLRSRGGDRSDVGERFRDWLRSGREGGSDERWGGVRDWLRARSGEDREWWRGGDRDRSEWWDRFEDRSRFGERHRRDRDDRDWWDHRDHRPAGRWPYFWPWYAQERGWYDDYRDYRRPYPYYRYDYGRPYYYDDYDRDDFDEVWPWLAFTAIAWKVLDNLNEDQQRQHEMALSRATTVPVGETVRWSSGEARGAVTPIREAPRGPGVYCREFRQEVMIGDRAESAFGTACRMPDGTWRIEP